MPEPLSYNEMRILWNSDEFMVFLGVDSVVTFSGEFPGSRAANVDQGDNPLDEHDTFNSFWLVWGNWQEYKLAARGLVKALPFA
jgi:hypothetical protein